MPLERPRPQPHTAYALDPELAAAAAQIPDVEFSDPRHVRERSRELRELNRAGVDVQGLEIHDRLLPGADPSAPIPVRIYAPADSGVLRPGVIQLHGGAFIAGDMDADHPVAARNASQLGAVVVCVNYRLAPEHPFPCGLEDCYAALTWLHSEAGSLGVDPERIAISGQSAGGGLAAALALLARDRGGPPVCFQFLACPELDDRLETPSARRFVDTPQWSRPKAEASWRWYLGESSAEVSPYAAPARAADLSGLPPAYVSASEFDPFRDEDVIYALRMMQADVPVELHVYAGTFHGSETSVMGAAVSRRQQRDSVEALRRGLAATRHGRARGGRRRKPRAGRLAKSVPGQRGGQRPAHRFPSGPESVPPES